MSLLFFWNFALFQWKMNFNPSSNPIVTATICNAGFISRCYPLQINGYTSIFEIIINSSKPKTCLFKLFYTTKRKAPIPEDYTIFFIFFSNSIFYIIKLHRESEEITKTKLPSIIMYTWDNEVSGQFSSYKN